VSGQCVTDFNSLKLQKAHKYIIFKLSDDLKEIEVESTSPSADYEEFREKLMSAKSKDKRGNVVPGARYAVYDFQKELEGEGTRNKITFITWISGDVPVGVRHP
jgi:cofilin